MIIALPVVNLKIDGRVRWMSPIVHTQFRYINTKITFCKNSTLATGIRSLSRLHQDYYVPGCYKVSNLFKKYLWCWKCDLKICSQTGYVQIATSKYFYYLFAEMSILLLQILSKKNTNSRFFQKFVLIQFPNST